MKYLLAFLIIPTAHALFIVAILLTTLYFAIENKLNRRKLENISQ